MPRIRTFDEKEILTKAMELFWEKGFHATSVQDLVKHLGVSRSSLYEVFKDKKNLYDQALDLYQETNLTRIRSFLNSFASTKDGIRALFKSAIQETVTDEKHRGCFVVNTTTELIPGNFGMQERVLQNKKNFEALMSAYLEQGVQNGEIDTNKDLKAIASFLFTLYSGLRVVGKIDQNPTNLELIVNQGLAILD